MSKELEVAIAAAKEAGEILNKHFLHKDPVILKKDKSFQTEADKLSEKKIISIIKENFPDHSINAEESGLSKKDSKYLWLIDPLDGTTNYTTGVPFFSVSIALAEGGEVKLGMVYDPVHKEMFTAEIEEGSKLNNTSIKVSEANDKSKFMVGYSRQGLKEEFIKIFSKVERVVRTPKILGSTALQLCYVAAGRLDADVSLNQNPWDLAAGVFIVKKAGGNVTTVLGDEWDLLGKDILASNGKIHDEILRIINE